MSDLTPEQREAVREKYGTPTSEKKIEGLGALGLLAGLAGTLIVLRKRSFFAVALSHATFPGGVMFAVQNEKDFICPQNMKHAIHVLSARRIEPTTRPSCLRLF